MSEYQKQKKTKPPIEELVGNSLAEPLKGDILNFVNFLRENKLSPQWASTNSYKASYKSRGVCIIKLTENSYQIWINTQYNEDFNSCFSEADEHVKKFLLDSMVYCFGCGSCKPGLSLDILGVPQINACYNPVIRMKNPDNEFLELAKRLVLLRKQAIRDGKAPKVTYIAMSKR